MTEDELQDLYEAAKANLSDRGYEEFRKYNLRLLAEGEDAQNRREILTGFIWDEAESKALEEQATLNDNLRPTRQT